MNKLRKTALEQYDRIRKANDARVIDAVRDAQGEVLTVASPSDTLEIMRNSTKVLRLSGSLTALHRPHGYPATLKRLYGSIPAYSSSSQETMLVENQGYIGGIMIDGISGTPYDLFGFSAHPAEVGESDPIQEALGEDHFYPPYMWAKALRGLLAGRFGELSLIEILAQNGFTQGAKVSDEGHMVASTGFMFGDEFYRRFEQEGPEILEYADRMDPSPDATHLSGLADTQALYGPEDLALHAHQIMQVGGSLT